MEDIERTPDLPRQGVSARSLTIAVLLAVGGLLPFFLMSALAPLMNRDIDFSNQRLTVVAALFFAVGSVVTRSGGRLADRVGWQRAAIGASIGSLLTLIGLSVEPGNSSVRFALIAILGGAAYGVGAPTANLAIASSSASDRQGMLFGLKQAAMPVAGIIAGISLPTIAVGLGWRAVYLFACAIPAAAATVAWNSLRGSEDGMGRDREVSGRGEDTATEPPSPRVLVVLAIAGAMGVGALTGLAGFLPSAAVEAGLSVRDVGRLVMAASLATLLIRLAVGWLADLMSTRGVFLLLSAMMVVGASGFSILSVDAPSSVWWGAIITYGIGWGWTGLFFHGVTSTYRGRAGGATGAVLVGTSAGAAGGPLLVGYLSGAYDYSVTWLACAAFMLAGAALVANASINLSTRRDVASTGVWCNAGRTS